MGELSDGRAGLLFHLESEGTWRFGAGAFWLERCPMPRIAKQIPIDAPADTVWQVLADFGAAEKWAPTVTSSRASSEGKRGVGAKRVLTTTSGEITEEVVVEWNEGHDFTFEIPNGLASIISVLRETWSVEQSFKGAIVAVIMDYELKDGLLNSILDRLVVRRVLQRMLVLNLAGLKYHVETGEIVARASARLPVAAVV